MTTDTTAMLNWTNLKHQIDAKDLGYVCPVEGCRTRLEERQRGHFLFDPKFRCSNHGIVFSPSTFEYEDAERNTLWGDYGIEIESRKEALRSR